MSLSSDLISQFVKITKDEPKVKAESTVFGTTVEYNGKLYVKLDGSELLTPVATTADAKPDERVTVLIKDHTATLTGNISSPSARTDDVKEVGSKIQEFEVIIAYKVTTEDLEAINATIESLRAKLAHFDDLDAVNAEIANLEAKLANIDHLTATDIEAINANIERIEATFGDFTNISTEDLEALTAEIDMLRSYTADFTYVSADVLEAVKANIRELEVNKLSATSAELMFANIDFTNIGEAAIRELFTKSGLIEDLIVGDGTITGNLVGVTIKGDIIEGGTVVADKLVVKGEDGLYYKLNTDGVTTEAEQTDYNSLSGSVITAKSITATKIAVSDLVAFDATIGGFHITDNSIYSDVKSSVFNPTRGLYLDNTGQFNFGDSDNYVIFFQDEDGNYKLAISAQDFIMSGSQQSVSESISALEGSVTNINTDVLNQRVDIVNNCESLILSALETYTQTSDFDTFRSEISAQLSIMADQITMNFNETSTRLDEVNGAVEQNYNEIRDYITFSENGILIGGNSAGIELSLDDTGIIFSKNGNPFGRWDGTDFYTGNIVIEVNERAQFGNFAYMPRDDGSLIFSKVR